jgi:UDP-N-acetylmuramate dehydrogenase
VIADHGIDAVVVHMRLRGCEVTQESGALRITAGAGEPWDDVVARAVQAGFGGIECLSGIPGSAGGTPIQNVGAYGQEVAQTIAQVTVFDRLTGQVVELNASECEFAYRQSRFKSRDRDRFIVTGVTFHLTAKAPTVAYPDLAAELERRGGDAGSIAEVREAVLSVRRRKGMVVDADDRDTRSVGSFFTNPVVPEPQYASIAAEAERRGARAPGFPGRAGVKVPAAWLIEQAGFARGHGTGAAGLSSKHPLAIVNRGGATARDIIDFAAAVKRRVVEAFGVWLQPEPVFLGFDEDDAVIAFLRAHA